ncbi:hypothetical protein MLD38_012459 [Melastoma candidum]|uniref:Uncharacterized protein n=1 Tax=Melastoma candidum TaxID=119954 RepID=A0ACB9R7H2_9MYRT|nr:hypothetical protein MLD38_012459 [Melastoma candidum]
MFHFPGLVRTKPLRIKDISGKRLRPKIQDSPAFVLGTQLVEQSFLRQCLTRKSKQAYRLNILEFAVVTDSGTNCRISTAETSNQRCKQARHACLKDPDALVAKYSDPLVYTGHIRVRTGSVKLFEGASSADKTIELLEGHVHDLLFEREPDRETVTQDMIKWLTLRLAQ